MTESDREEILTSMARTLYVTAHADACEDEEAYPDYDRSDAPGAGGEWFDATTGETPAAAVTKAAEIAADFETRNGWPLEAACDHWTGLEFHYGGGRPHDADQFGHYLIMTYIGSGVGLWDDHRGGEPDGFECGNAEFSAYDFEAPEPPAARIVDGGADLADRYTVEIDGHCWGFGVDPFHPQGFGQYCGEFGREVSPAFFNSQTPVALADLPENARKFVEQKQRESIK